MLDRTKTSELKRFGLAALLMMVSNWALAAAPVLIYDNIPSPLPPDVPSLGF